MAPKSFWYPCSNHVFELQFIHLLVRPCEVHTMRHFNKCPLSVYRMTEEKEEGRAYVRCG